MHTSSSSEKFQNMQSEIYNIKETVDNIFDSSLWFFKFKSLYPNVELDIYGSIKPNMQSDYQNITEYDVKMKMEFRSARFIVIKL